MIASTPLRIPPPGNKSAVTMEIRLASALCPGLATTVAAWAT